MIGGKMKLDITQIFKDKDGVPIPDKPGSDRRFILKDACIMALLEEFEGEKLEAKEKYRRYKLQQAIFNAEILADIEPEDLGLLKDRIAKLFRGCLIPGQAWEMLDPGTKG
jgi:hypothetical protein